MLKNDESNHIVICFIIAATQGTASMVIYIYVLQLVVLFSFSVVDNLTDPGEGKKDIHVGQYIICMTSFQDPDMQDPTLQVGEPKATPKNNLICSLLF